MLDQMLDLFSKSSPITVMFRGILESVLSCQLLDSVFATHAQSQYCRELTFSQCADLMVDVVTRIRPLINAAYRARAKTIPVSVTSVYNKLNNTDPSICEALVRETASQMAGVIEALGATVASTIPGYEVRIIDGNHLAGTQRRIKELRDHGAAALPGHTLAIFDPQRGLIDDLVTCEDAHSNQRVLFPTLLQRIRPGQCTVADSHFCTLGFLFGCKDQGATFIVRQHEQLQGELIGERKAVGKPQTGQLFEQKMRIRMDHRTLEIRRIMIVRDTPTSSGDTEIHLLTNLPAKIRATVIAKCYRERWKIETAFQDVTENLRCEINTLGYPRAALLGFSIALVIYNVLMVSKAAIRIGSPQAQKMSGNLSTYALADEIGGTWRGMLIAIPETIWSETFGSLKPKQLALKLRGLAKHVELQRLTTYPWSAKSPAKKKTSGNRGNHRATYRLIKNRKTLSTTH